jgi:hypothetical protein
MARYQFDDEQQRTDWSARGASLSQAAVRGFGFLLMLVGLWISLAVIAEAWSLYRQPVKIERLARAIEQGSHLDLTLSSATGGSQAPQQPAVDGMPATPPATTAAPGFRLTYFVAWIIAILLLLLVGRLALAAVKTGGELVLYDSQFKKFARALAQESVRPRGPAGP